MKKILYSIFCIFTFLSLQLSGMASEKETLIIFDASISMGEKFYGSPKYVTAVSEAKNVLDKLPASSLIGLRIIGLTIDNSFLSIIKNPAKLCESTKLVVPIGVDNIKYVKNSMDTIFPLGTTPLTYTLDTAINYDFSRSAKQKHIILITDGAESCNGDPCAYIKEVVKNRNDIKIDILAINVTPEDYNQLKCLSDSTFGSIKNIGKPTEFTEAFNLFFSPDISTRQLNTTFNQIEKKDEILYKNYLIETYK